MTMTDPRIGIRQINAKRTNNAIMHMNRMGEAGLTVADLRTMTGVHHGVASAVLSRLHKQGRAARLSERRGGCHIYVTLDHVAGRATDRYGRPGPDPSATESELTTEYTSGYDDGVAIAQRQVRSILRRHGLMDHSRLFIDVHNWTESDQT